jgi:hypothetical protein
MDEPAISFYIDDQKCSFLEKKEIQLSDGHYFVSLEEKHAQQMYNDQLKSVLAEEKFVA